MFLKANVSAYVLLLGMLLPPFARALPILEFEFLASGQTLLPTESVYMRGRITNTGDTALTGGVGQGSLIVPSPSTLSDMYVLGFPPGAAPFPPGVIELAPGGFIEWVIAHWVPYPLTGSPGDPVLTGEYIFPLTNISTSIFVPNGPASETYTVLRTGASDFRWTVQDDVTVVPQPPAIFLLTLVVFALCRKAAVKL